MASDIMNIPKEAYVVFIKENPYENWHRVECSFLKNKKTLIALVLYLTGLTSNLLII